MMLTRRLAVGEPGDRDGEAANRAGEGDPAHQPQLGVAQAKLGLDRDVRTPMICRSMKLKM